MKKTVILAILDGFALGENNQGNAVCAAKTPNWDNLWKNYSHTLLKASGAAVGLPEGQMGNSEVGHTTIGAGRPIFGDLTRINRDIADGSFYKKAELLEFFKICRQSGRPLHLMGLLSDGGVHSHNAHLYALLQFAKNVGLADVFIHCMLDGRDVSPTSGIEYIKELESKIAEIGCGKIATVGGRYFFMDRDKRFERTQKAYNALVGACCDYTEDIAEFILQSYQNGITDEFMPLVATAANSRIKDDDNVLFFNFRPDRARQITHALTGEDFTGFERESCPHHLNFACMTLYDAKLSELLVLYKKEESGRTLGEVLAENGLKQFRIAETEKYAHVTFFFGGGHEQPLEGEKRVLVPSPKVATYDMAVEMSAAQITEHAAEAISSGEFDFVIMNYANCDMVGHTGIFNAVVAAVECVDKQLETLAKCALAADAVLLITADHGNAEEMLAKNGSPMTAHTTNPVPFVFVANQKDVKLRPQGELSDIAPTVLHLLGLKPPTNMTGKNLVL